MDKKNPVAVDLFSEVFNMILAAFMTGFLWIFLGWV